MGEGYPRGRERLFHVFWKTAVAQRQMGGTAQTEFVICDQSIDTNHGYAKTAVVNSEVAKRRTALEQRLATLRRWTASARGRYQHATALSDRLRKQAKARGETLYRGLNERMFALEEQGMADHVVRREIKERKAAIDAELQELWQRIYRIDARQDQDWRKQERYCREQREVLRALEDLASKEREMYELDNRKDQVMTVCKVALVNLVMWTVSFNVSAK